jgi:hypothetical protein
MKDNEMGEASETDKKCIFLGKTEGKRSLGMDLK